MTAARYTADLAAMAAEAQARGEIDRRGFLRLCGAGAVTVAAMRARGATAAMGQIRDLRTFLRVATFDSATEDAWQNAWGNPFTSDTGTRVDVVTTEPTPSAIQMADRTNDVDWDCVDGDVFMCPVLGRAGVLQPYDYGKVDKTKTRPEFVDGYGCAAYLYSTVNAYNLDNTGGKAPNGYRDYLDFKQFPGKRAMYRWLVGSLEAVLLGDGVPPDKLYPLDVPRAFARIKEHKDQFVLWGSGGAAEQIFRDGTVVMGQLWGSRAYNLDKLSKGKVTWTWDHGIVAAGALQVPVDNPAGARVFDFIASTQDPQRQAVLFKALGVGTANPAAGEVVDEDFRNGDCGYEANYKRQIPIDIKWYAENYARVQNDFLDLMGA